MNFKFEISRLWAEFPQLSPILMYCTSIKRVWRQDFKKCIEIELHLIFQKFDWSKLKIFVSWMDKFSAMLFVQRTELFWTIYATRICKIWHLWKYFVENEPRYNSLTLYLSLIKVVIWFLLKSWSHEKNLKIWDSAI